MSTLVKRTNIINQLFALHDDFKEIVLVLLTVLGEKPMSIINSPKLPNYAVRGWKRQHRRLMNQLGLQVRYPWYLGFIDRRMLVIHVARDPKVFARIHAAEKRSKEIRGPWGETGESARVTGRCLGYPASAIEAYAQAWENEDDEDFDKEVLERGGNNLPTDVREQRVEGVRLRDILVFCPSRQNYEEELEVMRRWMGRLRECYPEVFSRYYPETISK